MSEAYQELIRNARDVCSNCHRVIRVERVDPTRGGVIREYESHYERHPQNTMIAYGPAETVSNVKGVFCDRCGTEDAEERIWRPGDVTNSRFATLIKQTIATLEWKGVSIKRLNLSRHALYMWEYEDATVDEALGAATEAAIVASAARDDGEQKERV